jgi:4-amino-4-deoxy-L-arabinose transferase-like glycosyltransferase
MSLPKYIIHIVVVLYVLLASTYSIVTPLMEASDELWHYPMVKYIADHWLLPVQEPGVETAWRQEGSQPPLYYFLGAVMTSWIDTDDLDRVRWLNPHADNGKITQDGNINLIVHGQADTFPWRGTALAIHLIRFLSVCMGAGTVYLTYMLVLEMWPQRRGLALSAAAIAAFNPMFCFISGAVNNDNLAMLLCALAIWLLVRMVRRHDARDQRRRTWLQDCVVLGVVLGLGVLTKTSVMGLLPLTALAVGYVAWRRRSWWHLVTGGFITAGLVMALSGWWFVRNALLYDGDWLGLERFIVILGYRVPPATLRQLWGERHGFMMAYWGLFGGVNVPLPRWVYQVLNAALLISAAGLVRGAIKALAHGMGWSLRGKGSWPAEECDPRLVLLILWPVVVVVSWAGWATKTWSSQGRLVFSAMSVWSTWMALGLNQFLPRRWSGVLPGLVGMYMLGVAAWAPWGVIAPAYQAPVLPGDAAVSPAHALVADMGGQVRLLGYDMPAASVDGTVALSPGEAVHFALYWEAQREMDRNWSVFCHILDPDLDLNVATRDRYPGEGLLATTLMRPGLRWVDQYAVFVPETVYAPSRAVLEIGLYDLDTGERPPIVVELGEAQVVQNALRFQSLRIEPLAGELPNPVYRNFEDQMLLAGWDVDRRVIPAGETLHWTLYWQCLGEMDQEYTVSTQVVGADGQKAAQADVVPGGVLTTNWTKGQQIVDRRALSIDPGAWAGGYQLIVSVYEWETTGELRRLRVIDAEGYVLPSDSVVLGQVRIVPAGESGR